MDKATEKMCTTYVKEEGMFKTKRCFLVFLIVTCIMESISLLGLSGYWRVLRDDLFSPRQQEMCFRLEKITSAEYEEKNRCPGGMEGKVDKRTDSTNCCGTASDILDRILAKALQEKYNSNTNPELTSPNMTEYNCEVAKKQQPIARLVNLAADKKPVQVGVSSKLFWNNQAPSYTNSGLRYLADDGTIYVEETGYYYIFSQLKTKLERAEVINENTDKTIRHSVHLISKGTGRMILEDAKSLCQTMSEEIETTSVMGAVFRLEDGDRLYVATSHPQNMVSDLHSNYFSMHTI